MAKIVFIVTVLMQSCIVAVYTICILMLLLCRPGMLKRYNANTLQVQVTFFTLLLTARRWLFNLAETCRCSVTY